MKINKRIPGRLVAVSLNKLGDGWHADGGNLYLFIRGTSKSWVFRYTSPSGTRRNMGLGSFHSISLAQARKSARDLREQVVHPTQPIDPISLRQEMLQKQKLEKRQSRTFKSCAVAYINAHHNEWKNAKHEQQWSNTLATYAYPVIGDLTVDAVDERLILKVLSPIWNTKTETAKRLRGRIESVLDWATFNKYRQGENPARWRGHLEHSLAKPTKASKAGHHAAMDYKEMASFMVNLQQQKGMGARALEFTIFTAARSGEVRGATWSEISFESKIWNIPANRMKASRNHRVALSECALQVLNELPRFEGTDYIFPSGTKLSPLSDMTLSAVLRRMGKHNVTVHGFRSSFRDWVAEATDFSNEMAEMALAHAIGNKVEAAYRRGDLLVKRFKMMNEWANYLKNLNT